MPFKIEFTYPYRKSKESLMENSSKGELVKMEEHGSGMSKEEWSNMLILGDCLSVLRNLMSDSRVRGTTRLIYIDPPFSTKQNYKLGEFRTSTISPGKGDKTAYEDRLSGAEYFEFLRERLILMREILADDGSIYVHIDSKIGHYVKVLMDEIFGEECFINDITRVKCNPKNFPRRAYGNIKDMILFYSKTDEYTWNDPREPFTEEEVLRLFPKIDEDGRKYSTNPLHAPGETKNGPTGQPWKGIPPPKGRHWRYSPDVLEDLDKSGLIEWSSRGIPRKKIYADEFMEKGKKMQDIWRFKDPQYPKYPTEKNLNMLRNIIEASSNPGDIVLDAFSGSGTTMVAAEKLNRRWIGIDNSPQAIVASVKRLQELKDCGIFGVYESKSY
ncbi:MAG: site-specific DNA-methyltransferase [Candidatus Hodarchaeota archaeon]